MTTFEIDTLKTLLHMYRKELEENGARFNDREVKPDDLEHIKKELSEVITFIYLTI